jgi:hypothetical protein
VIVGVAEGVAEKLEGLDVGADDGVETSYRGEVMDEDSEGVDVTKINVEEGSAVIELKLEFGICVVGSRVGEDVPTCNTVSLLIGKAVGFEL